MRFREGFTLFELLVCLSAVSLAGLGLATFFNGWFGTRGTYLEYEGKYQGKPALVKRSDIRFGPDRYYILIGDKGSEGKITEGVLRLDDGRKITLGGSGYSIRDSVLEE